MSGAAAIECDALVVGGGPAGMASASTLARAGLDIRLCDQNARLGGAIHRRTASGDSAARSPRSVARQWQRLSQEIAAANATFLARHVFLGIDSDGLALFEDRASDRVVAIRAAAVVLAVGAVERIRPRPGWQSAGVMTAGGLQMLLKTGGRPPSGRVLIAGNGPLPVALAAQLAGLGNPPVAVIEAGDPLAHPGAWLGLVRHVRIVAEAAGYLARMAAAGIGWRRGAVLSAIERDGTALAGIVEHANGRRERIGADLVALHDGIRPNSFGLPQAGPGRANMPFVVHAGDCREALGAVAAEADGRRAALAAIAHLRATPGVTAGLDAEIARERAAQSLLSRLFRPVAAAPLALPDDTLVCRCEGRTAGDLRQLLGQGDRLSPREIKLNGRFCMGSCQGRLCADTVAEMVAAERPGGDLPRAEEFTGRRWPARPVPIASITAPPGHAHTTNPQVQRGKS